MSLHDAKYYVEPLQAKILQRAGIGTLFAQRGGMELETWMFALGEPIPCQWRACTERFPPVRTDVYYDPAYCATWLGWEEGTAVALYAHDEGIEFLYCFLLGEVPYACDPHWRYDAQRITHPYLHERFKNAAPGTVLLKCDRNCLLRTLDGAIVYLKC